MTKFGSRAALAGAGLLLALGLWATPAAAQRADDAGMQNQNACQSDAYKFCQALIPDRAKVGSCLFKNRRQLSEACRTVIGGGGKASSGKARGKRHGRHHRRHR